MEDNYGNKLIVENNQIILTPPEGQPRNIGKIIDFGQEKIYEKHEKEKDTFRALNAWSINYNALLMCDYVHFYTNLRHYWIDKNTAREKGKFLKLTNSEEKIYVPKDLWTEYPPFETGTENLLAQRLGNSWYHRLKEIFTHDPMTALKNFLENEYQRYTVYPEKEKMFRSFKEVSYERLRVLIIGQDPYPDGQATGVAFETKGRMNASLRKILEGMEDDLAMGEFMDSRHRLSYLHKSGIMLLNTSLTVRKGSPGSHSTMWQYFTEKVIESLNEHKPIVYMLWGKPSQRFKPLISQKHVVLEAEHPAYAARQSRKWEHNDCFSTAREIIYKWYGEHIIW